MREAMNRLEDDVRSRLSGLRLGKQELDAIVEEIAEHLHSTAEQLCSKGMSERQARARVLSGVGNWHRLSKQIQRSKENLMQDRLRKIWLPGLGTGFLAYAAQNVILQGVARPQVFDFHGSFLVYSWQWLLVLVATGALGACWSRRMGAGIGERILVALAPSVVIGIFMIGLLPLGLIVEAVAGHRVPYAITHPLSIVSMLACIVILPSVPSLLGAALFLGEPANDDSGANITA